MINLLAKTRLARPVHWAGFRDVNDALGIVPVLPVYNPHKSYKPTVRNDISAAVAVNEH